jgi:transglutaminase-like putative cysteine protease
MRPKTSFASAIVVLLSSVMIPALSSAADELPSAKSRRLRFTYETIVRDLPAEAGEVSLWIPYPASDERQEISEVSITADHPTCVLRENEHGNRAVFMHVDRPSQGDLRLSLEFTAIRHEDVYRPRPASQPAAAEKERIDPRWLKPDRLAPFDGRVREMAIQATRLKSDRMEQARAIYDYVVSNLKYDKSGTGWGRGDTKYVCDAKSGNCSDFHALFIGMCRAIGIPARLEMGFPIPPDRTEGEIAGYHCWARFYVEGLGWIPVDASEANKHPEQRDYFFGAHDEHRVLFSVGRDLLLPQNPRQERINLFIYPQVDVDGKPHEKVDKKFRFRDLARPS